MTPVINETRRRAERVLVIAVPVVVAVVFFFWTGVLPGLYSTSPVRWTMELPTCTHAGPALTVEHAFPLWSTVHIRWTATADVFFWVWGNQFVGINQVGVSGNASFVSNAQTLVFEPSAIPFGGTCQNVSVVVAATYSG
jgi:hypothetical protein